MRKYLGIQLALCCPQCGKAAGAPSTDSASEVQTLAREIRRTCTEITIPKTQSVPKVTEQLLTPRDCREALKQCHLVIKNSNLVTESSGEKLIQFLSGLSTDPFAVYHDPLRDNRLSQASGVLQT